MNSFEAVYDKFWFARSEQSSDYGEPFYMTGESNKLKLGDWILFRHIKATPDYKTHFSSRPILALFTGYSIWDQALVVNFVPTIRAAVLDEYLSADPEMFRIPIWHDNIELIAMWNQKPTFSQLRSALKNVNYSIYSER